MTSSCGRGGRSVYNDIDDRPPHDHAAIRFNRTHADVLNPRTGEGQRIGKESLCVNRGCPEDITPHDQLKLITGGTGAGQV